ncbi:MAG TPA: efflux RND transporter permease subunit [bacterium]|nr:efflux RND transporter permease subunit [bacterium]
MGRAVRLGPSGRLAAFFAESKLTLLVVLASLLLGFLAVALTPREEEPQIVVPMVDVIIPFPGAAPREVEERVTTPVEKILWGIPDVEYLYSRSLAGRALVTIRFKVGTPLEPAVVRVHHKLREHFPEKPEGIGFPLVRSYTIDDVPFLALTFHGGGKDGYGLRMIAQEFARDLAEVPDVARIETLGGEPREVRIEPDPEKIAATGVSLLEFFEPLVSGNVEGRAGVTHGTDPETIVQVQGFFRSAEEVGDVVVGLKAGRAVRVRDVARVIDGPSERVDAVLFAAKETAPEPAVTLSFTKRPGTNATALAERVLKKTENLQPALLPPGVSFDVTRNYGETAREKSNELIRHLLLASLSVVTLIALALGLRFSLVVGVAVPVTLSLTLLIYYLFGYSLNRVTLFALIFSIGILVDDAIVVIENIHRHLHDPERREKGLTRIIIEAVDEVGNPTILATFTVIAAILPMAFVRGLMGPYMRPIPVGASLAMLFSLAIAFTISPWAALKAQRRPFEKNRKKEGEEATPARRSFLDRTYYAVMGGLIDRWRWRTGFGALIAACLTIVVLLVGFKVVRVKMLPFDNKSEFQVMIDLDAGRPLEATIATASEMGDTLKTVPEVENYQIYAGTSAPVNFNGLVRHYFLRKAPNQGDIQVNLKARGERKRQSHEIARDVRASLEEIGKRHGARVKVVEIPPGPPVLATLVAEVYGPDFEGQLKLAGEVKKIFQSTPGVVDVDWMVDNPQPKDLLEVDRRAASLRRVPVDRIFEALSAAFAGARAGLVHLPENGTTVREPVPIVIRLPEEDRASLESALNLSIPALDGSFVLLSDLVRTVPAAEDLAIDHKNLKRVVYVIGDVAGREESPIYALQAMNPRIDGLQAPDGKPIDRRSIEAPEITDHYGIKWNGEWQISYEVFRDLGAAFAVVMALIFLLVVGWFRSYIVPIVIMMPIPLSLIGIIPGHWMFGAFFTATSMIGFIAGAGIIVRNSIILVDFIELRLREGMPLREAVIDAGAVRFRPMLLTAAAVVAGSFVILFDPIFQGLAISLMMGEVAATLLSRFAVPFLYYAVAGRRRAKELL